MSADEVCVPLWGVVDWMTCGRLFGLTWVESDGVGPEPDAMWAERLPTGARGVWMSASVEGIEGRVWTTEREGRPLPIVAYGGALSAEKARLAGVAMALVLREAGFGAEAVVLVDGRGAQETVALDGDVVVKVRASARAAREVMVHGTTPEPLSADQVETCAACRALAACMPAELARLRGEGDALRRVQVRRPSAWPLYVVTPGACVRRLRHRLVVVDVGGERLAEVRLNEVSRVVLVGSARVDDAALRMCLRAGVIVVHSSREGRVFGLTQGLHANHTLRRLRQLRLNAQPERALSTARGLVEAKLRNARVLVRRNHPAPPQATLQELKALAALATRATHLDQLRGVEGRGARVYFAAFGAMLKPKPRDREAFAFHGRSRRPPLDPVNAMLSYGYTLLAAELTALCASLGFEVGLGTLHTPRYGRPSLALDLMEPFRSTLVDSTVLGLINRGAIRSEHFERHGVAVRFTHEGRRIFLGAWEDRCASPVRHPFASGTIDQRRLIEVTVRLFDRVLAGELDALPHYRPR